jgi:HTH-type transcriptional regulator / antitoxin HipB
MIMHNFDLSGTVRGRRRDLGLRQQQLADLAGCSVRFLHELENGKQRLALDKVSDVLEVLGLTLAVIPLDASDAKTSDVA